jgi:hypothetical protein
LGFLDKGGSLPIGVMLSFIYSFAFTFTPSGTPSMLMM